MQNFQNSKINRVIKSIAVIAAGLLLLVFTGLEKSIDKSFRDISNLSVGGKAVDSNIVIIGINESDIEKLGGWPLKRNYYALLINELSKLDASVIGIEVFLSDNLSFQSIYNDVLIDEINEAGNVVLGSLASGVNQKNNYFSADSIILPQPAKVSQILTGHLNFIDETDVHLPTEIFGVNQSEKSFSAVLFDLYTGKRVKPYDIKINYCNSFNNFDNISILEFFDLVERGDKKLNSFKDKIVLIGVVDPTISKSVSTIFDDELPGVGFHAFALDNLLNKRFLTDDYKTTTAIAFIIFILVFSIQPLRKPVRAYSIIWLTMLVLSYSLFLIFNIDAAFSFFILPLLFLTTAEIVLYVYHSKRAVTVSVSEKEILHKTLESKEKELNQLKSEAVKSAGSKILMNRIDELEKEIKEIKVSEEDDNIKSELNINDAKLFEGIVYKSRKMQDVVDLVKRVAPENASVLILGESGSGKELIAKALHNLSKRKDNNFVAVNCAALTDSLLESELFGHVKGAFTNAVADKIGRFEAADKGTIFLDEIGETSENFQVKLLRVLQTGDFDRVGSATTMHADVRVIAATNKNLKKLVDEKKFRDDLYYRLNVINIELPPLRERVEDIDIIADYFTKKEDPEFGISKAVLDVLENQKWKGNVRELESIIKRAVIFAKSDNRKIIKLNDLPSEIAEVKKADLESLILNSLREKKFSRSSINQTAKELGNLSRTIISENLRGIFLKNFTTSGFNFDKTVANISDTNNNEIIDRVSSKLKTYLSNIEDDVKKLNYDFGRVKNRLSSKYKNLPQKYHSYLDEIIKYYMNNKPGKS